MCVDALICLQDQAGAFARQENVIPIHSDIRFRPVPVAISEPALMPPEFRRIVLP